MSATAPAKVQFSGKVIPNITFEQYVSMDGINASSLKNLLTSPRLYMHRKREPLPDRDTLRLGRTAHTAILEPRRFLYDYAMLPEGMIRRGKDWDKFKDQNTSKTIISAKEYEAALKMADSVGQHPVAGQLLRTAGAATELSISWIHPRTAKLCKSRLDLFAGNVLVDIKTTSDPLPAKFCAQAARLHYPMQMAFYADAATSAGFNVEAVKIITVQSAEPYDVVVYNIPQDVISLGAEQYDRAIDLLIECESINSFPGMAPEEVELRLPSWAMPAEEQGPELFLDGEAIL